MSVVEKHAGHTFDQDVGSESSLVHFQIDLPRLESRVQVLDGLLRQKKDGITITIEWYVFRFAIRSGWIVTL